MAEERKSLDAGADVGEARLVEGEPQEPLGRGD
jgi:hypothetical protein